MPTLIITQPTSGDNSFFVEEVTNNLFFVEGTTRNESCCKYRGQFKSYEEAQQFIDTVNSLPIHQLSDQSYYCTLKELEVFCNSSLNDSSETIRNVLSTFPIVVIVGKSDFKEGVVDYSISNLKDPENLTKKSSIIVYLDESGNSVTLKQKPGSYVVASQLKLNEISQSIYQ